MHYSKLERVRMEPDKSPAPDEFPILGFSLVDSSGVYRSSHTINQYANQDNPIFSELSVLLRQKKRGPVHMELAQDEYDEFLLMMIIKNDLLCSPLESESLGDLVHFFETMLPN